MSPPLHEFASSHIPREVLISEKGSRRKDLPRDLDIKRDCTLERLIQYRCDPVPVHKDADAEGKSGSAMPSSRIECVEVGRLFRR